MAVVKVESREHWWASTMLTAAGPSSWRQASSLFKGLLRPCKEECSFFTPFPQGRTSRIEPQGGTEKNGAQEEKETSD